MTDARVHACAFACLLCAACAGNGPSSTGGCQGTVVGQGQDARCVLEVDGLVRSTSGAPLGSAPVSVCSNVCFYGKSDASGSFAVKIGMLVDLGAFTAHVDGRPDRSDVFVPLSGSTGTTVRLDAPLFVPDLPATGPALPADGAPASNVTSGPLTLAIADATTLTLTFGDSSLGGSGRTLRAADVPTAYAPAAAQTVGLVAIVAAAPFGMTASTPIGVVLDNQGSLPAGAAVELLALDDNVGASPPTAGSFRVVASGHVSADGSTVASDPGAGITELTWLGVRPKVGG